MTKNLKFILVFLGSGTVMFLIFYFYPAEIFDAEIIDKDGGVLNREVSLRALLGWGDLPEDLNPENVEKVKGKLAGWMIFIIIAVGMPLMFAYRSIVQKKSDETEA